MKIHEYFFRTYQQSFISLKSFLSAAKSELSSSVNTSAASLWKICN